MRHILVLLLAITSIYCDWSLGSCPKVNYDLETFDQSRYLGRWYELGRSKSIPFEKGDCILANYSLNDDGSIRVENSQVINGVRKYAIGKATTTSNPFKLLVSFSDNFIGKIFKGDYQVINTDYESFSIVYSCSDLYFFKFE